MRLTEFFLIAGTLAFFFVVSAKERPAQSEFSLERSGSIDKAHLRIEERSAFRRSSHSSDVPWKSFSGMTAERLDKSGPVKFEYVTGPGTFICEGEVHYRRARGKYTFRPNPEFAVEMRKLGFQGDVDERALREMALAGVTMELARAFAQSGVPAAISDLHSMAIHGVTPEYLREIRGFGFSHLNAGDFVQMKIHGVDTALMKALKDAGYDKIPQHDIVQLRIHGVSPQYLGELKALGVRPGPEDLVQYRIHGVSAELLQAVTATSGQQPEGRDAVELRIHGVTPALVREAHKLGYRFTTGELVELRNHGVDVAYLEKLSRSGYQNLTAAQITKLRVHGVD